MIRRSLQRVGNIARVAGIGLYAATLLPASGLAAGERPIDFGAALLMPTEVAQFGFEEYGIDSGRYFTVQQMVAEGSSVDPNDPGFEEIGMESVHNLIVHPIGGMDEHPGPDINIVSFLFVYDDEAHAEEGFARFEDESDDPTATDLDGAPALGDESELTEYVFEQSEAGETWDAHELMFSFRVGRVVASVSLTGFDDEVERDDVEAMAEYFEAKLLGVLNDGRIDGQLTPGLDSVAPRYDADDMTASRSHYCVLNGEALVQAYYADRQASLQEWIDEYGVVADYCSLSRLWLPSTEGAELLLRVEPTRFSQADSAARYVADQHETVTDPESGFEVIDIAPENLPFDADSVLAVSFESDYNGTPMTVTRLVVQQGRLVIDVQLFSYTAPDPDVIIDVMADAFGCADSACYETMAPPASLVDFQAEQDEVVAEEE